MTQTNRRLGNRELLCGPLNFKVDFFVNRPKSHFKSGNPAKPLKDTAPAFPTVKPDITKLIRSTEDALTGIIWRDDSQVSSGAIVKLMQLMGAPDDDETKKWFEKVWQAYLAVPDYDKTQYIVIPFGRTDDRKTKYLRVPVDEGMRFFGGIFYKIMNMPQNGVAGFPQVLDYTGGQMPGLNPGVKISMAVWDYLAGRNPWDTFRNQQIVPQTTFTAHNMKSHIAMMKWVANETGVPTLVWRRLTGEDNPAQKTLTEQVSKAPVVNDVLGRFIKVSDYGRKEAMQEVSGQVDQQRARELLELRDIATKMVKGEKITPEEQALADKNASYIKQRKKLAEAKIEGNTYSNELLNARSTAERYAMQKRIMEIEGKGFDLTPYIENDIVNQAQVLARKMPIKTADRQQHDQDVRETLHWFQERNVSPDTVMKLYRQSVSKMKDKKAMMFDLQRLSFKLKQMNTQQRKSA